MRRPDPVKLRSRRQQGSLRRNATASKWVIASVTPSTFSCDDAAGHVCLVVGSGLPPTHHISAHFVSNRAGSIATIALIKSMGPVAVKRLARQTGASSRPSREFLTISRSW
jgi:hypothetical protein